MRYKDGQEEGGGCCQAAAPASKMQCPAEMVEPRSAGRENEEIDQFMKKIQAVRDSSQVDDGRRKVF